MDSRKDKLILFGLDNLGDIISKIIKDLDAESHYFDIKLILTEALTNAFYHGSNSNKNIPIHLEYYYDGENVTFKIQDSGTKIEYINIPKNVRNEDLLKENGRGLFLIGCSADKVEVQEDTLIITKKINNAIGKNREV